MVDGLFLRIEDRRRQGRVHRVSVAPISSRRNVCIPGAWTALSRTQLCPVREAAEFNMHRPRLSPDKRRLERVGQGSSLR